MSIAYGIIALISLAMVGVCVLSDKKVFPHNLRHLVARTFYRIKKDIVRLADLLGHSSLSTTRIYTMDSGNSHLRGMEKVCMRLTT